MNTTEERLTAAFDAYARTAVPDERPAPAWNPDRVAVTRPPHGPGRRTGIYLAVAAVLALVLVGAALVTGVGRHRAAPAASAPPAAVVRVSFAQTYGATYGVGQTIVVRFSRPITDAHGFVAHSTVTVDGGPADGAWYFERTAVGLEAHYRMQDYWPADVPVRVNLKLDGVSAGRGLRFTGNADLQFTTGRALIAAVDGATHRMTVSVDSRVVRVIPVSLGRPDALTTSGVKTVLARYPSRRLTRSPVDGPTGFSEVLTDLIQLTDVPGATDTGEYVVPLNANVWAQGRQNVSSGSTDVSPTNGRWLYGQVRPGDVFTFTGTGGPVATGTGTDWNIPWATWVQGGALPTR